MDTDNKRQIEKLEAQILQLQKTRQCLCDKLRELEQNFDDENEDDEEMCCHHGAPSRSGSIKTHDSGVRSELSRRSERSRRSGESKKSCTSGKSCQRSVSCKSNDEKKSEGSSKTVQKVKECSCGRKKEEGKEQEEKEPVNTADAEERLAELIACARGRMSSTRDYPSDPRGPTAGDRGLSRELVRSRGCDVCPQSKPLLSTCWADKLHRSKQSNKSSTRGECDGNDDEDDEEEVISQAKPKSEGKCGCQNNKNKPSHERRKSQNSSAASDDNIGGMSIACRSPDWPCDDLYKELEPSSPCPKTSPCDPRGKTAEERGYKKGLAHPTVDKTLDLKKYKAFMKKDPRGPPRCRGADPGLGRCDDDCDDDGACGPGPGPRSRCTGESCGPSDTSGGCKEKRCGSSDRRGSRNVPLHPPTEHTFQPPSSISFPTFPVQQMSCDTSSFFTPSSILANGFCASDYMNKLRGNNNFEEIVTMCLHLLMVNAYGDARPKKIFKENIPKPNKAGSPVVNFESEEETDFTRTPSKWTVCDEDSRYQEINQHYEITEVRDQYYEEQTESSFQLMDNLQMDGVKINYVFNLPAYPQNYKDRECSSDISKQTIPSAHKKKIKDDLRAADSDDLCMNDRLLEQIQEFVKQVIRRELESWAGRAFISFKEESLSVNVGNSDSFEINDLPVQEPPKINSSSILTSGPYLANKLENQTKLGKPISNETPIIKFHTAKQKNESSPKLLSTEETVKATGKWHAENKQISPEISSSSDKQCSHPSESLSTKRTPLPRKGVPRLRKFPRTKTALSKISLPFSKENQKLNSKTSFTRRDQDKNMHKGKMDMTSYSLFNSEEDKVAKLWTKAYQCCGTI